MGVYLIEGIAAFLMYLLGGALVLFIYEAYVKTKQTNLMYMAVGFFVIIFGSNLNTLAAGIIEIPQYAAAIDMSTARTAALIIQLSGIIILLLSAIHPFGQKK
ncbi:hypothetical protein CUJ83_05195 [Methanocella sp. CWC-04]|uniref:Uncharacterized protein n=1 Tax=Methanooceanicella nereidis TaxID=2052831 RepID=A0AAP2RBD6_9EURY|nr:hypothetical protein [Methanocella sp. CWC-04]MCD1294394.1 hypothetical protein [Methanocella sp. CWC-04]